MKKLFLLIIVFFNTLLVYSQHIMVYKDKVRKVVNLYQQNDISIYYRDWPDTTSRPKAVLQSDILELIPILSGQIDSVFAVISMEREHRIDDQAKKEHAKKYNKYQLYFLPRISCGFYTNRLHYGGALVAGVESKNKYRVGVGIGYEATNQGQGFIYTYQLPLLISFNYNLLRVKEKTDIYVLAEGGYNVVLSGSFNSSRDRSKADTYGDYKESDLQSAMFGTLGIGACYKRKYILELCYKNQSNNVTYPINERVNLMNVNVGIKF